jgi:outer membrane receptor protein involved in Fe transport
MSTIPSPGASGPGLPGTYAPVRDVVFHGNYTHSLRAPSITELFAPDGSVYDSGNDPCSPQFITSGESAVRQANCAKAGVPRNFTSNINNYTVLGSSGGNRNLQNETADSFTGGVTLQPRWVRGLTINSDFIDINLKNEIQSLNITRSWMRATILPSFPNTYCSAFTRDPSGQITNFHEGYYNIANQHVRGVQSKLDYFLTLDDIGLGRKSGAVEMTVNYMHYVFNNQTLLSQTYAQVGDTANPRDSFTTNITISWAAHAAMADDLLRKEQIRVERRPGHVFDQQLQAIFYVQYDYWLYVLKHYVTNLNINNVFDAKPQYPCQFDHALFRRRATTTSSAFVYAVGSGEFLSTGSLVGRGAPFHLILACLGTPGGNRFVRYKKWRCRETSRDRDAAKYGVPGRDAGRQCRSRHLGSSRYAGR